MLSLRRKRLTLAGTLALVGLSALGLAYWISGEDKVVFALSHFGVGAVVAGVVGVWYERAVAGNRYDEAVSALELMGSKHALDNVEGGLKSLFPVYGADHPDADLSDLHSGIHRHVKRLVTATQEIEKTGRGRVVLIRFIEKLLKYSGDAAWTLSPDGSGPLNLPKSATVLAADILSEQMTALGKNDRYEVISDFTTWHNRELDKLRNTITKAVKRGAHVKRVFARFD